MTARIYQPAKTAMQSGKAKTNEWVIDFEPEQARQVEPLMGWTSSADMRQQLRLSFDTKEEAVAYCQRHGVVFQSELDHAAAPGPVAGSGEGALGGEIDALQLRGEDGAGV